MKETVRATTTARSSTVLAGECWTLVLVHGPDLSLVGRRMAVSPSEGLSLGRGAEWLGPGGMEEPSLSRHHCSLEVEDGRLRLNDRKSRNGSFVNGRRQESCELEAGDLVRVGRLSFLVRRAPIQQHPLALERLGCSSPEMARVYQDLIGWSARDNLLLVGDVGVGKTHLARWLHRRLRPGRPLVELDALTFGLESRAEDLLGSREQPGFLEAAQGGTFLLENVDRASEALQVCLLGFLEDRSVRCRETGAKRTLDVQVIATARQQPGACFADNVWREDFGARLLSQITEVPALIERREDIATLAVAIAAERGDSEWLERQLIVELLGRTFEHNVFDLQRALTKGVAEAKGAGGGRGMQDAVDTAFEPRGGLLRVSRDGSWFVTADGETVSLEHRKNLRLLLRALVAQRTQKPGEAMSVDEVFAHGWPGERVAMGAQNRVYVALSTMRKLGLRGVIERSRSGYLIPPGAFLVIEDD